MIPQTTANEARSMVKIMRSVHASPLAKIEAETFLMNFIDRAQGWAAPQVIMDPRGNITLHSDEMLCSAGGR